MKFSHKWLQSLLQNPIPPQEALAEKITFHSSEVEEVVAVGHDAVLDVKVLPDKSAWLLSHVGMANEIAAMTGNTLVTPLVPVPLVTKNSEYITIDRQTPLVDYYAAACITGVKVGPSPAWLRERIEAVGGRSINTIVDATNYVMYELGQPLHAFDAAKLTPTDKGFTITVRHAHAGEQIITLSDEVRLLDTSDVLITDGVSMKLLAIAGIKGGTEAIVTEDTTTIILESAHFDRVHIRTAARRLRLQTDAAKQFENGVSVAMAPLALMHAVELIQQIAGGEVTALAASGDSVIVRAEVLVSYKHICTVLGLTLPIDEVVAILSRIGCTVVVGGDVLTVQPPFWRDDLCIAEDVIEEVGRMYGFEHVISVPPSLQPVTAINARHYYATVVRDILTARGFSEIMTSSFRSQDEVRIENALASDKGYLRSTLVTNCIEAVQKNVPHKDVLGLAAVKLFEIGTVFSVHSEECRVVVAVQTGTQYKAKVDDPVLLEAKNALVQILGDITPLYESAGVLEFSLDTLVAALPIPTTYEPVVPAVGKKFKAFSVYPSVSRDVAVWVPEATNEAEVMRVVAAAAGPLLVRVTHVDTFTKDGRTSQAVRLVFQSHERTLTDSEVEAAMQLVYAAVAEKGFVVR